MKKACEFCSNNFSPKRKNVRYCSRKCIRKAYRVNNINKVKDYDKQYYSNNKSKIIERSLKWSKDNPERKNEHNRKFLDKNPHMVNVKNNRRRASKLNATPKWSEDDKIKIVYEKAKWLESLTGLKYHVDHIIPLKGKNVCGLHVWANLQILEVSVNLKKSNTI